MTAPTAVSRHEPLTPDQELAKAARARALSKAQWQRKTLPIMIGVLIAAMIAFLVLSFIQGAAVGKAIQTPPSLDLAPVLSSVSCASVGGDAALRARCLEWKVAVMLEQHTINRRYHQANVALLVRVTVKYLGFLTGMLMSLVGAVFVLGRLTEASSKLAAQGAFGKFTIATVSPGLILALLGTVLMISTVLTNPPTDVVDGNVYLNPPAPTTAR
ncbi:MAG TPA: hypothetical protein VFS57_02105 [Gemmatimonadaceae bacterium]|nr:hypothetical protein [Gemmatimonadaceae bacterium]